MSIVMTLAMSIEPHAGSATCLTWRQSPLTTRLQHVVSQLGSCFCTSSIDLARHLLYASPWCFGHAHVQPDPARLGLRYATDLVAYNYDDTIS